MSWHAIEAVEEAFEDTKELLFPFDLSTWVKLGIIAFLVGGAGVNIPDVPTSGYDQSDTSFENSDFSSSLDSTIPGDSITGSFDSSTSSFGFIPFLVAGFIGFVLLIMFISSVFEFIYYKSLLDREVTILDKFRNNLGNGAQYFIFKFLMIAISLGGIMAGIFLLFTNPLMIIPLILVIIPLFILFSAFNTLIHDFVLIEMLEEDLNLLEATKSMFSIFEDQISQTLVYIVMKIVIGVFVGLATFIGGILIFILLLIPFGVIGYISYLASPILAALVAVLGLLIFTALVTVFLVGPLKTFVYFYAVDVYSRFKS